MPPKLSVVLELYVIFLVVLDLREKNGKNRNKYMITVIQEVVAREELYGKIIYFSRITKVQFYNSNYLVKLGVILVT